MKMMATLPKHGDTLNTATVTDYCECGHAPYAHKPTNENDQDHRPCAIYHCNCDDYRHHAAATTQPEPTASEQRSDFSNWRVRYVAPTKPEHSFEPRCWIEADSAEHGASCRVFDVPDPDESQRAVAQLACDALNQRTELVAALETTRKMNQYIVEMSDRANIDNARQQARQAVIVADEALARVRGE